ncbi:NAD(P)/FAD-dependent oxidoreductase [Paraclostridium sordellii]|uniref:NAD(P)/FAD-dependent oxidoreductase n=1 Tax=Paraclostridium sordellii TaxID=1505 RepID=UPI0005DFDCC2|nr:NAD(P)/FAD-dependent oxidoreductase [Paeniclostridium sordellii]CEO08887.1 pyridine nucleotide-disulfide oxidoreductase [[Clostridium] sordellii] [Paeniclostridium sordellii]CEP87373.1 pyridine nucleotide-disulfide oxidoreductase [[Clostridium] sordellii] [Paeniclostridium sordellii]CEP95715.1 pyridine nucleotide-disulfide oxidoreductase [[Clostridium] sordellii] [Paeniclostridium sordellii]CEP98946.1 pyridine nucleotide-disulfide oxidoreductase [[Clostridium] sordellii] [Paeniclostridium so
MSKVIVVGGGPAGIMASISASKQNEVILIEKNNEIGKKLKLTGGGRCNITNNRNIEDFFDKVVNNKKFLYSSFYTFSNHDLLEYFSENNLEYKVEYDEKVYTKSDKADEVIEVLKNDLIKNNVKILYNTTVVDLIIEDDIVKGVKTNSGKDLYCDKVIVTTGGKSYPTTGSDGSMFNILKLHGHTIKPLYPALIPLVVKESFVKNLQGVAMKDVLLTTKIKKKKIETQGDMIFTHFGISGPGVLKFSSYINKVLDNGNVELSLDFLPNVSKDEISKIIRENPNKNILTNLKGIVPQNFIKEVLTLLNLIDIKPNELKKEDELKIIEYIKDMKLTISEMLTIKAAMVTSGGVSVKEINASTMESKLIKNLFFAGEVIDVDAETGGYNLQIAFSTGYLAGSDY